MKRTLKFLALCGIGLLVFLAAKRLSPDDKGKEWQLEFHAKLPLLGHRNWVLVVDKAFPLQSTRGMDYINANADFHEVLHHVLTNIEKAPHVDPIIYQDQELTFLDDSLYQGVGAFKEKTGSLLAGKTIRAIPHEEVFLRMAQAAELFGIVVIKTNGIVPYTSVFMELDCAYWDSEKESALRARMVDAEGVSNSFLPHE